MSNLRVDEFQPHQLDSITRPYKIIGFVPGDSVDYVCVEFLDVYEYDHCNLWKVDERIAQGWGVIDTYTDADNEPACILRRVRPKKENPTHGS